MLETLLSFDKIWELVKITAGGKTLIYEVTNNTVLHQTIITVVKYVGTGRWMKLQKLCYA